MTQPSHDHTDPETYAIIGAAMEVHRVLGHGFLEAVYQEALQTEFYSRQIEVVAQQRLPITYKGQLLQAWYQPDFIAYRSVIVEIKALGALSGHERAQVINYLRASGYSRGLLINFGTHRLQYERLVWNWQRAAPVFQPSAPSASSADTS